MRMLVSCILYIVFFYFFFSCSENPITYLPRQGVGVIEQWLIRKSWPNIYICTQLVVWHQTCHSASLMGALSSTICRRGDIKVLKCFWNASVVKVDYILFFFFPCSLHVSYQFLIFSWSFLMFICIRNHSSLSFFSHVKWYC